MNSWRITAFHPSLPNGQSQGAVSIADDFLQLTLDHGASHRLTIGDAGLRFEGFNNQQAFITHPQADGWTFLCTEPGFLAAPEIRHHPAHGRAVQKTSRASRRIPRPVKVLTICMLACLAVMAWIWLRRDAISASLADKVPVSLEKQIGDAIYQRVKATEKASENPVHKATVEAIRARLVPAIKDKRYELTFHIVENDAINAFAIPGGHIVIHSALLKAAKRPEEVAGVLAHEIAHATKRHSLRNVISSLGTTMIIQLMIGDVTVLTDTASQMLEMSYSRDFEREADATGWQYLLDAGIDPRGMIDMFRTLQESQKDGLPDEGVITLMSTHPAISERIATLEAMAAALPAGKIWEPIVVDAAPVPEAAPAPTPAPEAEAAK